jgi:hypothetical protein
MEKQMDELLIINGTKLEDKLDDKQEDKLENKPEEKFEPAASEAGTVPDMSPEPKLAEVAPEGNISTVAADEHVEVLLDKSIEASFPASDPPALSTVPETLEVKPCRDPQEDLLDEAIAMTFPASDPIAVSMYAELVAGAASRVKVHDRAA